MNVSELDSIIENVISNEIKKSILNEAIGEKHVVYHVTCEGEPIETFKTEEEANNYIENNKDHKKKLLVDKQVYESHSDMIEKLDRMGEELEEKENTNMQTTPKFKSLNEALTHAKENGHKKVKIQNEIYDVNEYWKQLEEEETIDTLESEGEEECKECGNSYMEETEISEDEVNQFKSKIAQKLEKELGREPSRQELIKAITDLLAKQIKDDEEMIGSHEQETDETYDEEGMDIETGHYNDEDDFEDMLRGRRKKHSYPAKTDDENNLEDMTKRAEKGDSTDLALHMMKNGLHEEKMCNECGVGYMNEETGCCNECGAPYQQMDEGCCTKCGKEVCECGGGMYESKKKTLRLTETELVNLINKMVSESIPGMETYKKAHTESGKQNKSEIDAAMADVTKNHINIDGSDKPEFPHQNGKGEKVAVNNTKEEDEVLDDNRGRNPFDLTYDIEPSKEFKDRLKKAIEGHSTMGNAPTTVNTNVKPSNGAKLGEQPKDKDGNVIPTPETGDKFEKGSKRKIEIKKKEPLYKKEPTPVKNVSESKTFQMSSVLEEEVRKMKSLTSYNKKTQ
jgi:hypothetical protein